ncbi:MAG: hypothetical protein FWC40_08535 [Proteobacteria bacterium]|nr:hypothetical protein [Pseudomonadota bacterium]
MGRKCDSRKQQTECRFKLDDVGFYADIHEPTVQAWVNLGALDSLPHDHLYLSACECESRNVVKKLLAANHDAIFVCGSDASLERFINHLRVLAPNPAKTTPIGFIPVARSDFAKRFRITLPHGKLTQLTFSTQTLNFPEIEGTLAVYIHSARMPGEPSFLRHMPPSVRDFLSRSPFSQIIPKTQTILCTNEAPTAYTIQQNGTFLHSLQKEQVIFHHRLLSFRATPFAFATPNTAMASSQVRQFFRVQGITFPSLSQALLRAPLQTDFLCQRIRLEFTPPGCLKTASTNTQIQSTLSIALSSRPFTCLIPRSCDTAPYP